MQPYVLGHLEPKAVFRYFEQLSRIPRESGNMKAAGDWCVAFAQERDLRHHRDEAGNVIIRKDASPGYEDHPAVILQGHLDMVCVKDADSAHDFLRDPLDLYVDGDFVRARGTTLGGDNGIAVAMAMAVLADDTLRHPPIEAVFTVDEEVGLLGATALDCSDLRGRILFNLDSEDEGILTVSCAGGVRCDITGELPLQESGGVRCTLAVEGLQGGHSGMAIGLGLQNANKLLAQCLNALAERSTLSLVSLSGGLQDNAIPKEAQAVFLAPQGDVEALRSAAMAWGEAAGKEHAAVEPGLSVRFEAEDPARAMALSPAHSAALLALVLDCPNGVQAMSQDIPGLVETSLNLGALRLEGGRYQLSSALRSSVGAEKEALAQRMRDVAARHGAACGFRGDYPAWEYQKDSPLRETMVRVFKSQYGYEPKIEAIHAGLECGILTSKLPGMDAVSMGPDLREVHSPRERLSISSTGRVWKYLLAVLEAL